MSTAAEDAAPGLPGGKPGAITGDDPSADPADAPYPGATGANPALVSAFAAIAGLVAEGDNGPATPSPSLSAIRRAAVNRAALRLDGSLAVLAEARRALAGEAPAAAIAAAEAECRRLSHDLSHYFPALAPADETGEHLPGRREFEAVIERLSGATHATDRTSSLMLIGVDRLSRLEAAYGEGASGDVLAAVGRAMTASLSGIARVFRFDLDVHAAVLPDMPLRQAVAVAENLRRSVMDRRLVRRSSGEPLGRITLSAGVVRTIAADDAAAAVDRAVRCLGEAQWHGGNRVVCETDPAFEQTLRAIA